MAIVQYLQKNVKYIRMCFLNLIKKQDTVWISADFLAELSAFFIAYISRRRSDQFGDTVFLHIFRHIYTDHCLFTAKYCFCKGFGKFCLSDTCRAKEKEGANRTVRIFKSNSSSFDCLCNSFHCFILSDHTFVEFFLQTCKTFCFSLCQFLQWDLGPVGNRFCDSSFIYNQFLSLVSALCLDADFLYLGFYFCLTGLCFSGTFNIRSLDCLFFLLAEFIQFQFICFHFRCGLVACKLDLGCRFVNNVNRFIRKETVIDVSLGHFYCCLKSFIFNLYAVVFLIVWTESFKDLDSLFC